MWPFEKHAAVDLASVTAATPVNVEVRVVSPNAVTSPVTGMRAAAFVVEVVSRREGSDALLSNVPTLEPVASLVVGDQIELAPEAGEVAIVAMLRRMKLVFETDAAGGRSLTSAPPELVPLLAKVPFGGTAAFRERALAHGDRVRLRAVVERAAIVVPGSETRVVLVVRDDLGPAVLEEISIPGL